MRLRKRTQTHPDIQKHTDWTEANAYIQQVSIFSVGFERSCTYTNTPIQPQYYTITQADTQDT